MAGEAARSRFKKEGREGARPLSYEGESGQMSFQRLLSSPHNALVHPQHLSLPHLNTQGITQRNGWTPRHPGRPIKRPPDRQTDGWTTNLDRQPHLQRYSPQVDKGTPSQRDHQTEPPKDRHLCQLDSRVDP